MHRKRSIARSILITVAACALAGCQSTERQRFGDAAKTMEQVTLELERQEPDIRLFAKPGPFTLEIESNVVLDHGTTPPVIADAVFTSSADPRPPLALIQHGNHSRKEAHRHQARRLATWGFHVLTLQQPNEGTWLRNGENIRRLVKGIARDGKVLGRPIDSRRIILIGHSFGGSAVTLATAQGAPVLGLILLDPAMVADRVARELGNVKVPVMLLGADRKIFRSRRRHLFFERVGGESYEISIKGATHDDAQYPSMFSLHAYGFDPFTSRDHQDRFLTAMTASALSLATTGRFDYAWLAFQTYVEKGFFKDGRRRTVRNAH